jgi:Membrane domain of glycerophosphoryl diester phosphodiesterase
MAEWEMRPLSLGEILDRTFTLFRKNFLLFVGISAIPHLLTLGLHIAQALTMKLPNLPKPPVPSEQFQSPGAGAGLAGFGIVGILVGVVVYVLVYLFSQGGTIYAVSDLYLGRSATIGGSLRRMWGQLGNLFGVSVLNGLAVLAGMVFLVVPGIYVACRLITCVPAALLEDLGARDSLERSWDLTRDNAGRSFLIGLLYFALLYGVLLVFTVPFTIMMVLSMKDPSMMRTSLVLSQVGTFLAEVLVTPFLLIATSVFYYDLRVKKEAFDIQMLLNPGSEGVTPGRSSVPSILG